uniref:ATPase 13A3 n=1 Tax=Eptatretus burgeri TaxID=7764 RepID=A0A8C4QPU4_EPTBU
IDTCNLKILLDGCFFKEVYGYRWSLWKLLLVAVATVCTGGLFPLVLYWLPAANVRVTASRCPLRQAQLLLRVFYGYNEIAVKVPSCHKLLLKEVLNPFYIFQVFSVTLWMFSEYYYYTAAIIIMSFISIFSSLYTIRKQYCMLRDMVSAHNVVDVALLRGGTNGWETVSSTELVPGDVINIPLGGVMMPCDAVLLNGTAIVNESMLTGESIPVTKTALPMDVDSGPFGVPYSPEEHRRQTLFCGSHVLQTRFYGGEAVCAVVVRTGFSTAKGQLVRSILFPKPIDFQLYRDAVCFLMCLAALASAGMLYTIILSIMSGVKKIVMETLDIVTIAVPPALPAALTAGIVYAQRRLKRQGIFSTSPNRINICGQINLVAFDKTGTLTEDGLDLWGVMSVLLCRFLAPVQQFSGTGDMVVAMATCHSLTRLDGQLSGDPLDLKMFEATGWIFEEPTVDDRTKYDSIMPTVVKPPFLKVSSLFAGLFFCLPPPSYPQHGFEVGIVQQFPFSSNLQRMSVVTRTLGERHMHVYCKGAPEKLATLCVQNTKAGERVVVVEIEVLKSHFTLHRISTEFCCSTRHQPSKSEHHELCIQMAMPSRPNCSVFVLLWAGDNILTAISVARNCGMVAACSQVIVVDANFPHNGRPASICWNLADDASVCTLCMDVCKISSQWLNTSDLQPYHFAVCGRSYSVLTEHFPDILPKIAVSGTVFARMSPAQKTHLIEVLQNVDYVVGMCGDGANDCGALKRAHGGISLSTLEASVASPFTSSYSSITCVPTLIQEGRAALMTSFCVFKFMALYSIIQFSTQEKYIANYGSALFATVSLAEAWKELTLKRPPFSLTSPRLIMSLLLQVVIMVGIQVAAFLWVRVQPWHAVWHPNFDVCSNQSMDSNNVSNSTQMHLGDSIRTFENTTLFYVSSFQYIFGALSFSKGPPFRQPIRRNCEYCIFWCINYERVPLRATCCPREWRKSVIQE